MPERRRDERTPVRGTISVTDEYFDEQIGILVDISPKGLKIKGTVPIEVNDDMKLVLQLPEQILGTRHIHLTAQCVWSKPRDDSDEWLSGFEFCHISQKDSSTVIGLILETKNTHYDE